MDIPHEASFVSPSNVGSNSSASFVDTQSANVGLEPMGELDGAINNLAMSAKYNLTQMTPKQFWLARWSSMQSWGSFIDTGKMNLPPSIQLWSKRLVSNLKHFQSNYFCVFLILFIYCILTSPLLLLVLAAIGAVGYVITLKNKEQPVKLFGKKLNIGQQYMALGVCSIPLLYIVGAGSAVFWVIGASLFVIAMHSSVYAIETVGTSQNTPLADSFNFEVQSV